MPANDKLNGTAVTKIAFFGDGDLGQRAQSVLTLTQQFGADAVVFAGDFDVWDQDMSGDSSRGYAALLERRFDQTRGRLTCEGSNTGVQQTCRINNVVIVVSGIGTRGKRTEHVDYIDRALTRHADAQYKVCVWHKNQRLMQIGSKHDEVGWDAYDTCRKHGALVATGHEHSYARSHTMTSFRKQLFEEEAVISLRPGRSFVFHAGVGGQKANSAKDDLQHNDWWAAWAATQTGLQQGGLMCSFSSVRGHCEFHSIDGRVHDRFDFTSEVTGQVARIGVLRDAPSDVPLTLQTTHGNQAQFVIDAADLRQSHSAHWQGRVQLLSRQAMHSSAWMLFCL
ncbi:MAG: hypothetical protein MHM6MM_001550 [Cercozoa sp. M6MM]